MSASPGRGMGCLTMVPAALIGFWALADGAGPRGWFGLAEVVGWLAVCLAVSLSFWPLLMAQGWSRVWRCLAALILVSAITYFAHWVGLGASMDVKNAFTSTLQVIGSAVMVGLPLLLGFLAWSGRPSR